MQSVCPNSQVDNYVTMYCTKHHVDHVGLPEHGLPDSLITLLSKDCFLLEDNVLRIVNPGRLETLYVHMDVYM